MTSKKDLHLIEGRRTRLKQACSNCRKAKKKCGEQRPCGRCIRMGKGDGCCDIETDYCLQTMGSSSGSSSASTSPQHTSLSPPATLAHILPAGHPHQHQQQQHQSPTSQQPQSQLQQQQQQFYTTLGHNLPPCLPLPLTLQHPQQQFFLLSSPHTNGQLQQTTAVQECFSSAMFPPVFGTTTTALYFHPNFAHDEPMPESPMYQQPQQQQHYNTFNFQQQQQQQHFQQQQHGPNASFPHNHAGETNNHNSNFTANLASEIFFEACVSDSSLALSGAPSSTSIDSGCNSGFSTPRCCGASGDHSDHDAACATNSSSSSSADQNTLMTDDNTWATLWAPEHSMSLPTEYDLAWASDSLLSSNAFDHPQQQVQQQQQPQQYQQQQVVFVKSEPLSTLYAPATFYSYAYVEPPALFSFPDGSVYGLNPECC